MAKARTSWRSDSKDDEDPSEPSDERQPIDERENFRSPTELAEEADGHRDSKQKTLNKNPSEKKLIPLDTSENIDLSDRFKSTVSI